MASLLQKSVCGLVILVVVLQATLLLPRRPSPTKHTDPCHSTVTQGTEPPTHTQRRPGLWDELFAQHNTSGAAAAQDTAAVGSVAHALQQASLAATEPFRRGRSGRLIHHIPRDEPLSGALLGLLSSHLLALVTARRFFVADDSARLAALFPHLPRDDAPPGDSTKETHIHIHGDSDHEDALSAAAAPPAAAAEAPTETHIHIHVATDKLAMGLMPLLRLLQAQNGALYSPQTVVHVHAAQPFVAPVLAALFPSGPPCERLCDGWYRESARTLLRPSDALAATADAWTAATPAGQTAVLVLPDHPDRTHAHADQACARGSSADSLLLVAPDSPAPHLPVPDVSGRVPPTRTALAADLRMRLLLPAALPAALAAAAPPDLAEWLQIHAATAPDVALLCSVTIGANAGPHQEMLPALARALAHDRVLLRGSHYGHCFQFPSRHPITPSMIALLRRIRPGDAAGGLIPARLTLYLG